MTQRFYSLAGIRYRFLISEECSWDTVRTLTDYVAQPGPWDVECVLSISEELSAPEGQQCYHSASTQVFMSGDTEISYHGSVAPSLEEAYIRIERKGNKMALSR